MAVEIRIMTNPKRPKARKALRMIAEYTAKSPIVVLWEGQELFRGMGEDFATWIKQG